MNLHENPNPEHWIGRKADQPEYWHQFVKCISDFKWDEGGSHKVGILGYPGEEGVIRNQGRPGTKKGPELIRSFLGGIAFHLPEDSSILDYGDIVTNGQDLESTQELICETVKSLLDSKHFPVLLGGGHDLAYAHGKGILNHLSTKNEKLGIINLDAHFDLRPKVKDKGHSGSPFSQLYQEFPDQFNYLALGIQRAANPRSLFETAKQVKANYLVMEQFRLQNWEYIEEQIIWFLDSVNKVYLTIDLDGFSSAYAPGVSAPSPMGFSPQIAFKAFELIAKSKKMISLDIVELNPLYDKDDATARLASRCVEYILRKIFEGKTITNR
ncbi:formimidoylglutamase [Algoriphagus machipongonensis]|uniref:Formimidoylglutamase n=1 Tax=Algoriphagus machipongonensis TaxID=388413 RepID=A3I0P5_9BACT|nr:formimidoylglutamase [Algoriphagus machipongonensis]EAZ80041.1 formimidoylglutamase [Algoriphagus machipongonensis]